MEWNLMYIYFLFKFKEYHPCPAGQGLSFVPDFDGETKQKVFCFEAKGIYLFKPAENPKTECTTERLDACSTKRLGMKSELL